MISNNWRYWSRLFPVFIIVGISLTVPVWAGPWELITRTPDGDSYYIDRELVRNNNLSTQVWVKAEYAKPTRTGMLKSITLYEFKPRSNLVRILHMKTSGIKGGWASRDISQPEWRTFSATEVLGILNDKSVPAGYKLRDANPD